MNKFKDGKPAIVAPLNYSRNWH